MEKYTITKAEMGQRFKKRRKALGMTLSDLAKNRNFSESRLYQIETGFSPMKYFRDAKEIASALYDDGSLLASWIIASNAIEFDSPELLELGFENMRQAMQLSLYENRNTSND